MGSLTKVRDYPDTVPYGEDLSGIKVLKFLHRRSLGVQQSKSKGKGNIHPPSIHGILRGLGKVQNG